MSRLTLAPPERLIAQLFSLQVSSAVRLFIAFSYGSLLGKLAASAITDKQDSGSPKDFTLACIIKEGCLL